MCVCVRACVRACVFVVFWYHAHLDPEIYIGTYICVHCVTENTFIHNL